VLLVLRQGQRLSGGAVARRAAAATGAAGMLFVSVGSSASRHHLLEPFGTLM